MLLFTVEWTDAGWAKLWRIWVGDGRLLLVSYNNVGNCCHGNVMVVYYWDHVVIVLLVLLFTVEWTDAGWAKLWRIWVGAGRLLLVSYNNVSNCCYGNVMVTYYWDHVVIVLLVLLFTVEWTDAGWAGLWRIWVGAGRLLLVSYNNVGNCCYGNVMVTYCWDHVVVVLFGIVIYCMVCESLAVREVGRLV